MHNIVLIITDTFRYDNLGDRAAALPVATPALDRFAAGRAAEVHGFYTGSFPTIPHRTDMATGRLGWPHYGWQPIDLSSRNHAARLLARAGYATQLICDCPHLFRARFDQAFDAALHNRGQEGDRPLLHLNDPLEQTMPRNKTRLRPEYRGHPLVDVHRWTNRYYRYEAETFPARTGSTAVRWLEENYESGPFFLWVDFFDPHEPWDPPEYLVRHYDPDYAGQPMLHPNYGRLSAYTPAEARNMRAHYAAEAELVDRWIGRLLEKLGDLQLWGDSVVVVTSDHGFSLGEHDRMGKSNISEDDSRYWPIYPEIGHVPFLVAAPGVPEGADLALLAQPVDFLPTVCDLAQAVVDPPEPFHGRSFADVLREGRGKHRELAVSGCCLHADTAGAVPDKAVTPFAVTDCWGYAPVGASGTPELYDIRRDPLATDDVAREHPAVVAEMHARLVAHLREHDAPADVVGCWSREPRLGADGEWALDYARSCRG